MESLQGQTKQIIDVPELISRAVEVKEIFEKENAIEQKEKLSRSKWALTQ